MEKRKKDKKASRAPGAGSQSNAPSATGAEPGKKKGVAKSGPKVESEEQLLQIIDDLRNDL